MVLDICGWEERNWEALLWAIYRQRCILLLGPDAALEAGGAAEPRGEAGEELQPSSVILANQLAEELAQNNQEDLGKWISHRDDLPQVAQYYVLVHNRLRLEPKIMAFYEARKAWTSPMHRNLARLPFHLVISSTWDRMMANALGELREPLTKKPRPEYYNFRKPRPYTGEMGTAESPLIYHLFGCPENPDSLVITESDLLDLLVKVASGDVPVPEKILTELINEDNCLLFLGFGFRQWYLRILLHVLKIGSKKNPSFALEEIGPQGLEEARKATLFIKHKGSQIQICNAGVTDFVAQMTRKYQESYPDKGPPAAVEAVGESRDQPQVFLSYVRENEGAVRELRDRLRQRQLQALMDYDFLEPGDVWSGKIDNLIGTFDYFILVLSRDLAGQDETYVYHELELARERQSRLQPGKKFIVPVRIDDCAIPAYLEDLHVGTLDLREGAGLEALVQTIRRDFQLRRR